jgi:hypothetical protein
MNFPGEAGADGVVFGPKDNYVVTGAAAGRTLQRRGG